MLERYFGTLTDVIAAVAAAAALAYLCYELKRRQDKLRDLFYVLGPDSALMTEHLEALVERGALRPEGRPATA
jgi:hypothetical protein